MYQKESDGPELVTFLTKREQKTLDDIAICAERYNNSHSKTGNSIKHRTKITRLHRVQVKVELHFRITVLGKE